MAASELVPVPLNSTPAKSKPNPFAYTPKGPIPQQKLFVGAKANEQKLKNKVKFTHFY